MSTLFEPSPILLAFLALKTTIYLPVLLMLALLRGIIGAGPARGLALVAVAVAAIGIAARFAPPLMGLTGGPLAQAAYSVANAGGGMVILLAASLPLALSGVLPVRRWPVIDAVHGLLIAALFVLWWLTQ
jgi:hypothetical protein